MTLTTTILAIIATLITIAAAIHKMRLGTKSNNIKHFELFLKVQELCGLDARKNLAALKIAMSCFTKRSLDPKEIEWFVLVPGAFAYIERYGKAEEYIEIDYVENSFCYKKEYQSKWRRRYTTFKLFLAYLVTGTSGVMFIKETPLFIADGVLNPSIALNAFGGLLCLMAAAFLRMNTKVEDAFKLPRVQLS